MKILDKENYKVYKNTNELNELEFIIKLEWGTEVSVFGSASIEFDEDGEIDTVVFNSSRIHDNDEGMDITLNKDVMQSISLLIEDSILNDTSNHYLDIVEDITDYSKPFISEKTIQITEESMRLNGFID